MNRKFFISLGIILFIIFSFSICFANDGNGLKNAANGVRDFVGGVENTVENAAKDVSNVSKDATGSIENGMNKTTDNKSFTSGMTDNNDGYRASRVSTDANTRIMGMTSNTWTWLILGIAAIVIIALVWYYSMQFTNTHNNDD